MMHIYQANRLESLVEPLSSVLSLPLADPLADQIVVVPGQGMGSWLSRDLAERNGICANVHFPMPARFVWDAFRQVLPGLTDERIDGPETLVWRLMGVLSGETAAGLCQELDDYLTDADDRRRLSLARGLAGLYDSYLVYRPQWVWQWSRGEGDHWQAELWRRMFPTEGWQHWADVLEKFFEADNLNQLNTAGLPQRICLFGIDSLSPAYLEVLRRLGRHRDIYLFVLNPCAQSWDHIISESALSRHTLEEAQALYLEAGNSLLAGMGRHGRDFIGQLQELEADWSDHYTSVSTDSMLGLLQSQILELQGPTGDTNAGSPPSGADGSVQVHCCHSPMREVEVLYERLLDMFERYPDLKASDVAILTPSPEIYGPVIDTVFRYRPGRVHIPVVSTGSGSGGIGPVARAFLGLIGLPESHYEVNAVLALLELPAIRRRFGLNAEDLERVHGWLQGADIRWGIDDVQRGESGLADTTEHTWRQGLERLMLGYALAPDGLESFNGIFPESAPEGSGARLLGQAVSFFEAVFSLRHSLAEDRSVSDWAEVWRDVLEQFFDPADDQEDQLVHLLHTLQQIEDVAGTAGFSGTISQRALASHLEQRLQQNSGSGRLGFGRITVGSLAMARGLPFQVICLLGLNTDVYPSPEQPLAFDLMAKDPARGDQSRRNEDRYRFLQALLAARRVLYISYVGRSVADNSIRPPSVLVSELLDYVDAVLSPAGAGDGGGLLPRRHPALTEHPLQAFSKRNFDGKDPGLFSYDGRLCDGVARLVPGTPDSTPFLSQRLNAADESFRELGSQRLAGFLSNPARFLLRQRLGVWLERSRGLLEDTEPFVLEGREARALRSMILDVPADADIDRVCEAAAQRGLLPHGRSGRRAFERVMSDLEPLRQRIALAIGQSRPGAPDLEWEGEGFRLQDPPERITDQGRFEYSAEMYKDIPVWTWLEWWVRHLVFNLADVPDIPKRTECLLRDGVVVLKPLDDPQALIGSLLELYWQGIHEPIHLFAAQDWRSSRAGTWTRRGRNGFPQIGLQASLWTRISGLCFEVRIAWTQFSRACPSAFSSR